MGTMIEKSSDVVSFLKGQHQRVKQMFERVLSSQGEARDKEFAELRRFLAVHETAEEEIVHPAARKALPDGEAVVSARLEEESKAKKVLSELEKMDVRSAAFEVEFKKFQAAVVAHAEAEEKQEFERLHGELEPQRLERMRKAVELAESIAPTHPHPSAGESAAANMIAGPFVAMVDRARDAISGKS